MNQHNLKTWPEYFNAIVHDLKNFEIRKNDRDYSLGDILILKEYNPKTEEYTGKELAVKVTFVIEGGQFGVKEDYVLMSIKKM